VHEAPALCAVRRTAAMSDLERRLRFTMVASVGGRRPAVSAEQLAAALRWRGIPATTFSVHTFAPEDFLVVLESEELRRHAAGLPTMLVAGAPMVLRPWNRQSQAKHAPLTTKVWLVLEGIPPHAWDVEVVEDLLAKSCAMAEVAPETRWRMDLSLFKLTAWTSELDAIPVARTLAVPEPLEVERPLPPARELPGAAVVQVGAPPASASKQVAEGKTLQYRVLILVVEVEELESEELVPSRRAQDGDDAGRRGAGPRDGNGGGGEVGRRRRRSLPSKRGVVDQRGGPGPFPAPRRCGTGGTLPVDIGGSWGLPPLASPGPWTVQTTGSLNTVASGPVLSVGAQAESVGQGAVQQGHATVGLNLAAPSRGGEHVAVEEMEGDAGNIPEVGPWMLMAHTGQSLLWQDTLESLPQVMLDPEFDHAGLAVEGSPVGGTGVGLEQELGAASLTVGCVAAPACWADGWAQGGGQERDRGGFGGCLQRSERAQGGGHERDRGGSGGRLQGSERAQLHASGLLHATCGSEVHATGFSLGHGV
jgi:hypothetical protein